MSDQAVIQTVELRNCRGQRLVGTLHLPPSGKLRGGVVVSHGMLSQRTSRKHARICAALGDAGVAALRFDFAGRGDSDGSTEEITYQREVEDLAAAVSWLRPLAGSVALVGSSMGGAVSLLYAAQDVAIVGVVGLATVCRPGELSWLPDRPGFLARWEADGVAEIHGQRLGFGLYESVRTTDVVGAASRLACPLLLAHGDADDVIGIDQARQLSQIAPRAKLEVFPGGDHVFSRPEDLARVVSLIVEFMDRALPRVGD